MIEILFLFSGVACCFTATQGATVSDGQNPVNQNVQVIDNIFNIPITAIKQTASAARTFIPEGTDAIDSVFKIPISTLEAVGNLVKVTTAQRRENADEIERARQERRERIQAQKERQRLQREQLQIQRLRKQQLKRLGRHHSKDPLGLNTLTDLLVGNHALFGGFLGGHGLHGGGHGSHGTVGGLGSHGNHGIHGVIGSALNGLQNTYEVHENVNEDATFSWHGITAGVGSYVGTRPFAPIKIENKIAPQQDNRKESKYPYDDEQIQNKVAPTSNRRYENRYETEPPLENKVAPRSNRISFYR